MVGKYKDLLNYFKDDKVFPSTFTSLVFSTLALNPQYDDVVTCELL